MGLYMKDTPAKERLKIMLGAAFWLNVPWFVMGIGSTIGGVPSIFHYFRPRDGNPFVLSWWGSVFTLWIISLYWIFIAGGAAKLAKYGVLKYHSFGKTTVVRSETGVKLIFLMCLAGGIIFAAVMWLVDIPLQPFVK